MEYLYSNAELGTINNETMRTEIWTALSVVVFVGLAGLTILPVPIPEENDCLIVKGTVLEVFEGGTKDVIFRLQGQDKMFYINRGLERGFDLEKLKMEFINKEITIKYPDYWRPLMLLDNSFVHISKIESGGSTVFSEID